MSCRLRNVLPNGRDTTPSRAARPARYQRRHRRGPQLATVAPYAAQLTALSKVPAQALAHLSAHAAAVQKAAAQTAGQWKTWYWICFGGIIFFLLSIPLLKGRRGRGVLLPGLRSVPSAHPRPVR